MTPVNGTCNGTSASLAVSSKSNPTKPSSITGATAPCQGASQIYSVTNTTGNTYNWTVPSGWTILTGQGTYSISVTVGSTAGNVSVTASNGCSTTTATNLAVSPVGNTLAQPSEISGPTTSCPSSTNITYSVENVAGVTYTWVYSDAGSWSPNSGQGTNSISVNYTAAMVSGTWTVTPSNACGTGTPRTLDVTVGSGSVAAILGPVDVCQGSTYSYSTDAGMTGYSWAISPGGGTGSNNIAQINNITWETAGIQTVQVSYNSGSGCTSYSEILQVNVHPMPVPSITGPASMCAGTGGHVYTTETGMSNYVWVVSSGGTITSGGESTDNTATVTWNTAGAQYVTINYENSYGCTRPIAIMQTVTVNPLPSPTITGPTSVCEGSSGNVYITESGMTDYAWSVPTGGIITAGGLSTDSYVTVTWTTPGAHSVIVSYKNSYGCTMSSPFVYNVAVHGITTASITGLNAVCTGATGNLYSTASGMSGYVWTVSGGGSITAGGGSSDNTVTVTWNTAGPQSVSVRYTDSYGCPATQYNLPVTVTQFSSAAIVYPGSPYCLTQTTESPVYITGTASYLGGTYSASSAGLSLNPTTGAITPSLSSAGTYTVTYYKAAAGGCAPINATTTVTLTAPPYATFYYAGNPFCSNPGAINVTLTGSGGGTFSATPAGLSINAATGAVNYTSSTPGDYLVTYSIPSGSGCGTFLTTAHISINKLAVPNFHYNSNSYCQSGADPAPVFTDGGVAGTFTAVPAGLSINSSTGVIDLSASAAGIYYVTNSITGTGPCPPVTSTFQVGISATSNATITYSPGTYCSDAGTISVIRTGTIGGTYSATPSGLSIDTQTGAVNISASTPNTYTVTYSVTGGCGNFSTSTQLVINQAALAITGVSGGQCDGASTQLGAAPIAGHTYSWTSNPAGFSSNIANPVVTPTVTTTYYLTETVTATLCSKTNSVTISPGQTPSVSANPSSQSVCSGSATSIQILGSITGSTFSWTAALVSGSSTSGFSSGTGPLIAQTLTNTSGSPAVVRYTITASAAGCTGAGTTVDITVNPVPSVPTISAGGPTTFCSGGNVTLTSSSATGNQWLLNGSPIGSAVNQSLLTNLAGDYSVRVTNGSGCSATSNEITVVVNDAPALANTGSSSICIGETSVLTPSEGGTWTSNNTSIATITNAGLVTGMGPGSTTFVFTTTDGCSRTSNPVTVYPLPVVTGGSNICVNGTTNLSPSTGGTWVSNNSVVASVTNSGLVTGLTAGTSSFTFTSSVTGCSQTTSSITVTALPVVTIVGSTSVCVGQPSVLSPSTGGTWVSNNPAVATVTNTGAVTTLSAGLVTFTFTATGGCSNTTDPLTVMETPVATIVGSHAICGNGIATLSPSSGGTWVSSNPLVASVTDNGVVTGVSAGTATFTFTLTSTGCSSTTAAVTVNSVPTVSSNTYIICGNGTATLSPSSGGTWVSNNPAVATVSGNVLTGVSIGATTFTFTATATGCSSTTLPVTVSVGPAITSMTATTCSGTAFTSTPVNGTNGVVPTGTTYSWSAPTMGSGISGGAAGSGSSITGTLINSSTTTPGTATYLVTASTPGCTGNTFTLTVTVNPTPPSYNISFYQYGDVNDRTFCGGQNVYTQNDIDILLQPGNTQPTQNYFSGSTVQYQYATDPAGTWNPASGSLTIFYQFVLPTPPSVYSSQGNHYFRMMVTNSYGCSNNSDVIELTITSGLTANAGPDIPACQQSTAQTIALTGASVSGVSSTTRGGSWSVVTGPAGLSSTAFTTNPAGVTYTIPANYSGVITLLLTTNDPDGNGSDCTPVTDTRIITIGSSNVVAGSALSTCSSPTPSAITLSGATIATGTTATWSFSPAGAGTLSNTGATTTPATVTFTPTAGWSGSVTLTLSGTCDTDTRTLTVNASPSCTIIGTTSVCPGTTNVYSAPAGAASYLWYVTGGAATIVGSSSGQSVSISVPITCGSYTLNSRVTSASGCISTCSQLINYTDSQQPAITCNGPASNVNANNGTQYIQSGTSWDAVATDNCTVSSLTYTLSGATSGVGTSLANVAFNTGTTTVTWKATDYCGNSAQCSYSVTVNYRSDLRVTKTASPDPVNAGSQLTYTILVRNVGASAANGVVITDAITSVTSPQYAISLSGPWNTWTGSYNAGNINSGGSVTLYIRGTAICSATGLTNTVTATSSPDNEANPSDNTATITTQVIDEILPVFSFCPTLKTVCNPPSGTYTHSGTDWDATVTDNCGLASFVYLLSGATTGGGTNTLNGQTFNPGVTYVTWRAKDNAGNTAECGFMVTVINNEPCLVTGASSFCPNIVNTYTAPESQYDYNPYTYNWTVTPASGTAYIVGSSHNESVQVIASPECTSYTLELTIPNLCVTGICSVTVTNGLPALNLPAAGPFCVDASAVQLNATPAGGTYTGTGVSTTGLFNPASAGVGTHQITYTYITSTSCISSVSTMIIVNSKPVVTINPSGPFCSNDTPYQLLGSPSGGTFSGTGVASDGLFNPGVAGAGTHVITYNYTDANGCSGTATTSITVFSAPTVTLADAGPLCTGSVSVQLTGTPSGGTYSGTGVSLTGLFNPSVAGAGSHLITYSYTDGNNCTSTASITITVNDLPALPEVTTPVIYCLNATASQLTATGTGLLWYTASTGGTGSATAPTPSTATTGNTSFWVSQTSTQGCEGPRAEIVVTILPLPAIVATGTNPALCGNNGTINFTFTNVTDGTYTIYYDGGSFTNVVVTSGTASVTTPAGTYNNLTITSGTCTSVTGVNVTITSPAVPVLGASGVNPALCGNDGTINFTLTNVPNGSYTINYDGGSFTNVAVTGGTASVTTPAGTYNNLTITSGTCTSVTGVNVTITSPAVPVLGASGVNPALCGNDGTINFTLTNVPNGSYTINYDGGSFTNVAVTGGTASVTTPAGTYNNLTITSGTCTSVTGVNVTITSPAVPVLGASGVNPALCGNDGTINFTLTNVPNGSYTINYDGGSFTNVAVTGGTASATTPAGTYNNLTITSGTCTSATGVNVTITSPAVPVLGASGVNPVLCGNDGTINFTLTNVTDGTYTIYYDGGSFTNVVVTSGTASVTTPAGTYNNLTITSGTCTSVTGVNVTITSPAVPVLGASGVNPALCGNDGTINFTLTNVPNGTYTINYDGGSFTNVVVAGGTASVTTPAGTYNNLTITSGTCTSVTGVNVTITSPAVPVLGASGVNPALCGNDGTINFTLTNIPNGTYTINFDGGSFTNVVVTGGTASVTTPAGTYNNLTITSGTCTSVTGVNVTITSPAVPVLGASGVNPALCGNDGTINFTLTNIPNGTYTINFDGGSFTNVVVTGGTASVTTPAGTYNNLTITSGTCTSVTGVNVTITSPAVPVLGASGVNPVLCGNDGTINFTLSNVPNGSYTINYDGGSFTNVAVTGGTASVTTPAGTYNNLTITSGTCTSVTGVNVTITSPAVPVLSASGVNPVLCGNDGTINFTLTNVPNGSYTINYDGGSFTNVAVTGGTASATAPAGTYNNLTITSGTCTSVTGVNVTITSPAVPVLGASGVNPALCGNDGTINFTLTNVPNGTYTINYDGGSFTNVVVTGGTASLTVPEGNYDNLTITLGTCTSASGVSVTITSPAVPVMGASGVNPALCGNDGSINFTFTNVPNGTYTINYDGGSFTNVVVTGGTASATTPAGTYNNLTITSGTCTSATGVNVTITSPAVPVLGASGVNPALCGNDGTINFTLTNVPNGTYTISYDGGSFTNVVVTGGTASATAPAGTYNNLTIPSGTCTSVTGVNVTITSPATPILAATGVNPVLCGNDGTINFTLNNVPNGTYTINFDGGSFTNVAVTGGTASATTPAGTYNNLTITSGTCTSATGVNVTITSPAVPVLGASGVNPALCGNDGTINFTLTNVPNGTYTINFDGGSFTNVVVAGGTASVTTPAGTYNNITITSGTCTSVTGVNVTITSPAVPVLGASGVNPALCGNDGTINFTLTNVPNGTYTINYDGGSFTNVVVTGGTASVTTPAGTYNNLTITSGTCTSVTGVNVTITSPAVPVLGASGVNPALCGNDGTINFTLTNVPNGTYTINYDGGSFTNVDCNRWNCFCHHSGRNLQ